MDYKHGRGVLVEATDNPQMKLSFLDALKLFNCIFDINTVSMTRRAHAYHYFLTGARRVQIHFRELHTGLTEAICRHQGHDAFQADFWATT